MAADAVAHNISTQIHLQPPPSADEVAAASKGLEPDAEMQRLANEHLRNLKQVPTVLRMCLPGPSRCGAATLKKTPLSGLMNDRAPAGEQCGQRAGHGQVRVLRDSVPV
jgi:hypothetical protein